MFDSIIKDKLAQQKELGLLRHRIVADEISAAYLTVDNKKHLNFASNDYLGIASDKQLNKHLWEDKYKSLSTGSMASPLVVGRHTIHQELEQLLLDWVDAPQGYGCLLFGSGYSANMGVISALFNRKSSNALLFQDKLNHASLMDVGRNTQALGHCKQIRFSHNDLTSLASLFIKHSNGKQSCKNPNKLVVTEGVFSMDGDQPELNKLINISKKNNAWFMLDDAHGIGVHGKNGAGSLSAQGVALSDCDVLVVTFGKAIGAQGAAVIATKQTIEYLTNFSRDYIYSTHLSPLQTAVAIGNIKAIQQDDWRREKLAENITYFKKHMNQSKFILANSDSPIQPIIIGDETKAVQLSEQLKGNGVWASAMRYPTVAKQQARIRVTISAAHSKQQLDQLIQQVSA
jgi:8-amino-7-oxononanoate synthase